MPAVTAGNGAGGQGLQVDVTLARQVAQRLKQLGDSLIPGEPMPSESPGPEKSIAAIGAVYVASEHFSKECGSFLQREGETLERAVHAFESMDQRNAGNIGAVDPRNR
ncbi:hypothetical protein BKG70_05910 [Mycobacteroides chelonae]|nr:hypothetical protein BKG67_10020 [Mycobacteroides chelonae]OHT75245.1 hypothetical protein BKG66_03460 [Mycobacteroides chelonae]OHT90038.1 hypothetical protein BKG70_05910 [Mycobacteroides chelonae]OHU62949.1 hypothetical protein BKG85_15985 [Mycobacteroides chelonae]